jgi:hypothetical protein
MVDPTAAAFFAGWPGLRLVALGNPANAGALELRPLGVPAEFLDAVAHPRLLAAYARANAAAFPGALALPGWVLADLYLQPAAITLLVHDDDTIVAAWCGVPTVVPGEVMGVSLLSTVPARGAAGMVKRLGLAMQRAVTARGITQWTSPSLRAHTRLGPLDVLGPAPAVHGAASESFVYRCRLRDPSPQADRWVSTTEGPALAAAAARGERVTLVAPGLDDAGRLGLSRA